MKQNHICPNCNHHFSIEILENEEAYNKVLQEKNKLSRDNFDLETDFKKLRQYTNSLEKLVKNFPDYAEALNVFKTLNIR